MDIFWIKLSILILINTQGIKIEEDLENVEAKSFHAMMQRLMFLGSTEIFNPKNDFISPLKIKTSFILNTIDMAPLNPLGLVLRSLLRL